MLKPIFIVFLSFLGLASLSGQIITFQKAYIGGGNDDGMWGVETPDGFLLCGKGRPTVGNSDALLIRTDRNGEIVWQKNYGANRREFFRYAAVADDGFWGYGATDDISSGAVDAWVVKVDDAGNELWQRTFGDSIASEHPNAPLLRAQGGCVVSGTRRTANSNLYDSFIARLDENGDALWSRMFMADTTSGGSSRSLNLGIQYVTDSVYYAVDREGGAVGVVLLDPATGALKRAFAYKHAYFSLECFGLRPTSDGNFALMGFGNHPPGVNLPRPLWLIKIRPDGQVLWSKSYESEYAWITSGSIMQFNTLSDGGFILCPGEIVPPLPNEWRMLMKIDANGEVVWKKSYSFDNGVPEFLYQCFETSDGGIAAIGTSRPSLQVGQNDFILMKTYGNGALEHCCAKTRSSLPSTPFPLEQIQVNYLEEPYLMPAPAHLSSLLELSKTATDICTGEERILRYDTLSFCPGDGVTLGDSTYTQPTEVWLPAPWLTDACDTVHIYTLLFEPYDTDSHLTLDCPSNIVLPDAGPAAVHFDEPSAASDCNCPGISLTRVSGGGSGDVFPAGLSTVCYRAEDACGKTQTCCFSISLQDPTEVCDEKKAGCLDFELLKINRDAAQRWVYYLRVRNHCTDALNMLFFQVPDGMKAVTPLQNEIYEGPGGGQFTVSNPHYSPFYSIRFKSLGAALPNGQSEVFRYVLPAQADVDYIHAAARLASGALIETHLNTFGCAVGVEKEAQPGAIERSVAGPAFLFPNPLSPNGLLQVSDAALKGAECLLRDTEGRLVWNTVVSDDGVIQPERPLAPGVYFFRFLKNGALLGCGKLVVLN